MRGGVKGHRGLREEGGRSAVEGGRNGDNTGRPHGETELGGWTTTAKRRTIAEKEHGRRGHDQVSRDGDGGEHRKRRDGEEESDDASEGWSNESAEDSAGLETEE